MVGLLTCSCYELPSRFSQWQIELVVHNIDRTYSSGTVQDSHLIPF